jgi:hypothetical protein
VRFGRISSFLALGSLVSYGIAFSMLGGVPFPMPYAVFMLFQVLPFLLTVAAVVYAIRSRKALGVFTGSAILGLILAAGPWIIAFSLAFLFVGFGRTSGGGP